MNHDLSDDELAALESFRVGDSAPLKKLPAESFQRVTSAMTWGELLLLGTSRQQACAHPSTTNDGLVRGDVRVRRCLDCGLLLMVPAEEKRDAANCG